MIIEQLFYFLKSDGGMGFNGFQRSELMYQADRIERVLSSLELPTKILGGQIGEGRVRYFLTPTTAQYRQRMRQLANRMAEEIGVYNLHISESDGNLVLDLPMEEESGTRLFPLLESIDTPPALTAIIGIGSKGRPFSIDFRDPESKHLLIRGGSKSGKSEFLRTVLFSIALNNSQTQANFLAVDRSGNELSVLEALPHSLAEVASEGRYGIELLHWLIDEIERREVFRIHYPELFLLVDDFERLSREDPQYPALLKRVMEEGRDNSVHVILATGEADIFPNNLNHKQLGLVTAAAVVDKRSGLSEPKIHGRFRVCIDRREYEIEVAWIPAFDLQEAVSSIQLGKNKRDVRRGIVRWF
jgi:hypothetical protein